MQYPKNRDFMKNTQGTTQFLNMVFTVFCHSVAPLYSPSFQLVSFGSCIPNGHTLFDWTLVFICNFTVFNVKTCKRKFTTKLAFQYKKQVHGNHYVLKILTPFKKNFGILFIMVVQEISKALKEKVNELRGKTVESIK